MADILDKRPVDAEMTIFKTEVEPNKLNACIDNILMRLDRLETSMAKPVDQWISVKDRLPEPEKDVLVWYRYTWGAGFTSYRFGISKWYSNIKRWHEGCLPKDLEVLYWQPLSEPPQD